MPHRLARYSGAILLILALPPVAGAQDKYQDPSPAVARILGVPGAPLVTFNADRSKFLMLERAGLPPIAEVAAPELRLAGARINPMTNALSRAPNYSALIVQPIGVGETRRIVVPWKAKISSAIWSPDGRLVAYTQIQDGG
ncbi:MAG TPA: hypothetical protein VGP87_13190, partial [Gemmatimonadales bacterium]|nr:hypothetical protein [Gemmatimonadales bacterium]